MWLFPDFGSKKDFRERERVCCLLVLNLVSSTLPCIRRPRPRLRVLDVCGFAQKGGTRGQRGGGTHGQVGSMSSGTCTCEARTESVRNQDA